MNRREFSQWVGLSALAGTAGMGMGMPRLANAVNGAVNGAAGSATDPVSSSERMEWARAHFKGFENVLMPSFTPDLSALDADGIRLDVRKSIEHGFFSTLCAPIALSHEEMKQFLDIAVDEAKGRIAIGFALHAESEEKEFDLMAHAGEIGCEHFLLDLPSEGSQQDLIAFGEKYALATDLGIYLWQAQKHGFRRFNAAGIPYETYDALADLPNIIALKVGDPNPAVLFELFERYNDRMLIGALMLNIMPMGIKAYDQQWSGAWTVEALQSPEKPYATDFFKLMMAGDYEQGMDLYWRYLTPAFGAMMQRMGPLMPSGGHPWEHLKYYQFAVGGNGGRMRPDPHQPDLPPVTEADMAKVNAVYRAIDIEPTDLPAEAFFVGRTNWEDGVRLGDLV